jgi:lipopolysaccharide heptosyltransferase II
MTNDIKEKTSGKFTQCLVMAFGAKGVGDHISCSSFIRNLAQNHPEAIIDFGAFSSVGAELFKHNPYIRHIHVLDMDFLKIGGKYSLLQKKRYIKGFRTYRYDRVYVLGTKFRHAVFAWLTGGKERIGYGNHHRGFLLTKIGVEPVEKNVAERFLDILLLDGLCIFSPYIEMFLSDDEIAFAENLFRENGIVPGDTVVALSPFASDRRKTWGFERFWTVAERLAHEKDYKVIILGAPTDMQILNAYPLPKNPSIINLVGKLSILESAAIIKKSSFLLSNDSGLGHVAGAVGTKALILGTLMAKPWSPLASSVKMIIKDVGCTSCDLNVCDKYEGDMPKCMETISVDEVIQKLDFMQHAS